MLIEEAKRGTCQHWTCSVPILKAWMESASTSSDLISEVSSLADSDIRDLDLDSVNVGAISQVVESSQERNPALDVQCSHTSNMVTVCFYQLRSDIRV